MSAQAHHLTLPPTSRLAVLWPLVLWAAPLGYLWWLLINQLRVPWSANPQYAYGMAVPFLCAYLLWRRWQGVREEQKRESGNQKSAGEAGRRQRTETRGQGLAVSRPAVLWSFAVCALLVAPTRLVQEANPEWSLVSWALALEVIGLTLLAIQLVLGAAAPWTSDFGLRTSGFVFPLCFFLVAVPWPYFLEHPVIQALTRLNTACAVEVLSFFNVTALQQGNVIELGTGEVGIDEACSGIRSLQATLMLALFFGELRSLTATRRGLLVLSGFGLAFLFNVGRTTLLTSVAARHGVEAIRHWHDPAGVTILVGCFLGLWTIARALGGKAETLKAEILKTEMVRGPEPFSVSAFPRFSIFLAVWLVLVEFGVESWYRRLEAALPAATTWRVAWPTGAPGFCDVPIPQEATTMLRYDEARQAQWTAADGGRWQLAWFYWKPGRAAGYLAKSHNPRVCMPATGYSIVGISPPDLAEVNGLRFPFRIYSFEREGGTVHVLYSRWDDRATEQSFGTEGVTRFNRLRSVWRGRGNHGQRVIGLALWGARDAAGAREKLLERLRQVLVPEPAR